MKKLIEFKLWAGQAPYFVTDFIGGVEVDGKRYGISKDTKDCYLPDTVVALTPDEFVERVKVAHVRKALDNEHTVLMTDEEKEAFAQKWLEKHTSV